MRRDVTSVGLVDRVRSSRVSMLEILLGDCVVIWEDCIFKMDLCIPYISLLSFPLFLLL